MARPKTNPEKHRKNIALTLDPDLLLQAQVIAANNGQSLSRLVEDLLLKSISKAGGNHGSITERIRIVFADDLPLCDCCQEPWCEAHLEHYSDCDCVGPSNAEELGYFLIEENGILWGIKLNS